MSATRKVLSVLILHVGVLLHLHGLVNESFVVSGFDGVVEVEASRFRRLCFGLIFLGDLYSRGVFWGLPSVRDSW